MNEAVMIQRGSENYFSGKIGHWRIGNPIGVVCPFCGWEQNIPSDKCPACKARLRLRRRNNDDTGRGFENHRP